MLKKRTRVVIVDDNDMMRSILRSILRGDAYEVVGEARNGLQAVEVAERLKPEIICMDVMMPEMGGIEAMGKIRTERPETEVVMITSNADPETVQESIMNGASGFIVKPFNAAKVLDTLARITDKKPGK
jgi:two-component system chemotaxis response regulator CheY